MPTNRRRFCRISGIENGRRLESRILEERIQKAVEDGYRWLEVEAYGQHGIGGRLWKAGKETVYVRVHGSPGQRVGAMGFPNTRIEVMGPASDDVGWLNAGAEIIVHGNAANGTANAMAQGKIYVAGNIGARGMTMTKHNPRFEPPELWVLGSAGDYFAEFMAGGVAVICGYKPQDPDNVLGYRPCVGMVGGKIFFRGPHRGFSHRDAKLVSISDEDWQWLLTNLEKFLAAIGCPDLFGQLADRKEWQLLVARSPLEKPTQSRRSLKAFREEVWEPELGRGGLIGDLVDIDRSPVPVITTGDLRRFAPVWENRKYAAPCEANCPAGMPVQERWRLIREGRVDEAVDLALAYTPFPATVCGYLCPNLCLQGCTRQVAKMVPPDVRRLGKASIEAKLPGLPPLSGGRVAVIGGGPAGISAAWQLRRRGHEAVIYDMQERLGGKLWAVIPKTRVPEEVLSVELERVEKAIPRVHLRRRLNRADVEKLRADYDFIVVAVGAQRPRLLPVAGKERIIPAVDFLRQSKQDRARAGKRVVIIGAGNVGCDVAAEAHRMGAEEITLIHYRRPPAFGEEKKAAEAAGAKFLWPRSVKAVTDKGVELTTGEVLPADTVVMATGHEPELDFLPASVSTTGGFIAVNEFYQTSDPKIFAVGDAVKLGFLTDAIGAGSKAAQAIDALLKGRRPEVNARPPLDYARVKLAYFDPRLGGFGDLTQCAAECASCGTCRDCGICIAVCPQAAISKKDCGGGGFEMVVDPDRCIGCGFCAGACPCGVWNLVENDPLE
jgi:NADPH-dependent glutamate synthase beta subunit-like oxidoreductase/glutamate synthase domain-containing protein 3/NAD-dependent dihydropyrimidine dehydrogenase PreA subunit